MKKIGLILLVGMALFAISCEESNEPLECAADIGCTEVFISINYEPRNSQNEAIILDSFYSQNLDNGAIYNFGDSSTDSANGIYVLITDAQLADIKGGGTTIRFIGEVGGEIVHEQDFVVGHDCCHVLLISGPGVQD